MTLEQCYQNMGGDYADAVSRLGSAAMVERFALRYLKDATMEQLRMAVLEGDVGASFRCAHTLKGVAANLSFTRLMESASALTEQLRPGTSLADPALFARVEQAHREVVVSLTAYGKEK